MGSGTSKQLGERVVNARKKLEADLAMLAERAARLVATSPETLDAMVQSITASFERCVPFSEPMLLVAFEANPEEVQRVLSKSCKKVLSAPIQQEEYEWFMKYVFPSSIWMQRTADGLFMFERMMII